MSEKQRITSPDLRKYRMELPNLYDDSDLTPNEFRLLAHYVRRGTCYEGVRKTAKCCNMSHPTVIRTRNSLVEKGYILTWQDKDSSTIHVQVIDKWPENYQTYSGTQIEQGGTEIEQGGTQVESKKEPIKKEPFNTKRPLTAFEEAFGKLKDEELSWALENIVSLYGKETYYQVLEWSKTKTYKHLNSRIKAMETAAAGWDLEEKETSTSGLGGRLV